MKITINAIDNNGYTYNETIVDEKTRHFTMMWIRKYIWYVVDCYENKIRIDIACHFGDTHMEITHGDKWTVTYVEDEFFCDEAIEFDTKGELVQFLEDILTNLEQADKAEEEWGLW